MKVIGAGLPRTGTLTQKIALEMLGLGPCYHMVNVLADLDQVPLWRGALEGRHDWDQILSGFQSCVDWPTSFYYQELLEAYPEAKVVLSVRDPLRWEQSMRQTIWDTLAGDSVYRTLSLAATKVNEPWCSYIDMMTNMWERHGTFADDANDELYKSMDRHVEAVKSNVPAGQLLVWEVRDGWGPLCEFLQVDEPDAPFPHLNDASVYQDRIAEASLRMLNEWWSQQGSAREPASGHAPA
jgi:Sulfotransferase domain